MRVWRGVAKGLKLRQLLLIEVSADAE